jgi:flagellar biosynthesis protein FlhF
MRIRRFVAKNSREALRKVKEEMGSGAVILGSRTLRSADSSETQPMLEVTAAVSLDSRQEKLNAVQAEAGGEELILERWQRLEEELQELKEILWSTEARSTLGMKVLYNSGLHRFYAASRELGIHSSVIRPMLKVHGSEGGSRTDDSMQDWQQQALVRLLAGIEIRPSPLVNGDKRVWSFIGPTGVGKTTTMAKLAALIGLHQGKSVALITVDKYRIGAIGQMRTYAQIMGLPLETAANAEELGKAIQKHSDKQVLLIDTAGRSPAQQGDLAELASVFQVEVPIQHQLVLSATTQYNDLVAAASAFQQLSCESYIFTKLDETCDGAAMVNFLLSRPRPLSYFATGQRVPEDIEPANKERLATLLLQRCRHRVTSADRSVTGKTGQRSRG